MPQLDKFTYFTQFFWSCLFLFTFYIPICNDGDGVLGISRILKLRNQLVSNRGNKIRSNDPKSLEDIFRKGFSTGVSYLYSSLFEVSKWCNAVDLLGKRRKITLSINPVLVLAQCFSICLFLLNSDSATLCDGVGVYGPPSPLTVGNEMLAPLIDPPEIDLPPAPQIPTLRTPLIPDLIRRDELYARFSVNTIGENPTLRRMTETLAHQTEIERLIEAALVQSGFNPSRILENRHRIRGILFYPRGRALSLRSYAAYLRQISLLGTRDTRFYQRLIRAIQGGEIIL
ncbi:hypothetical protein JHK87_051924 [Glycine soja]|nr:hypothetical protein JHK87_051913 [Glycine soja]KAG4914367.1 hypothetical protein JHK87_051924 [Glycine soja]